MIVATGTGAKQASGTKLKAHTASNERCGQPIDEHTSFTSTFALKRRKTRIVHWRIKGGGAASRDIELERSELQLPKIRSLVLLGT